MDCRLLDPGSLEPGVCVSLTRVAGVFAPMRKHVHMFGSAPMTILRILEDCFQIFSAPAFVVIVLCFGEV